MGALTCNPLPAVLHHAQPVFSFTSWSLASPGARLSPGLVIPASRAHLQAVRQYRLGMAGTMARLGSLQRSNRAATKCARAKTRGIPLAHTACSCDPVTHQHACKQRSSVISGLWSSGGALEKLRSMAQHARALRPENGPPHPI